MLFLFYINDFLKAVNNNSKPVLFADDTIAILCNPSLANFKNYIIFSFEQLNSWFNTKL
jgi:hypothetical protein